MTRYKLLITTGCLMWIISFLGEALSFQPYSTIGIIVSPALTMLGLFYWYKDKTRTGGSPSLWTSWKEMNNKIKDNPFLAFEFLFKHVLEIWTITILFWMGLVLIMHLTFGQSDAFKTTKNYCESNGDILKKTGTIKYYGVLVGGTISTDGQDSEANLSFTIVGENGNFTANSELQKKNGEWTVNNITVND